MELTTTTFIKQLHLKAIPWGTSRISTLHLTPLTLLTALRTLTGTGQRKELNGTRDEGCYCRTTLSANAPNDEHEKRVN